MIHCLTPPFPNVSILNGLPQGSACVCSELRPSGHVVNLLDRFKKKKNAFVSCVGQRQAGHFLKARVDEATSDRGSTSVGDLDMKEVWGL